MIDFAFTDEERLLRETAARFSRERLRPASREAERMRAPEAAVTREFASLGLGDAGLDVFARVVLLEELGWGDAASTLALNGRGLAQMAWGEIGGDEGLPSADRIVVVWEDPEPRLRVTPGGPARVSGELPWVPADRAAAVLLLEAGRAHWLDRGFSFSPVRSLALDAAGGATLAFHDAPVSRTLEPSSAAYARAVARLWTYAAALLVGVSRAALEYVERYTQDRTAFGRPIAHHQGVAFLVADCAIAVEAARIALWRATAEPEFALAAWHEAIDAALFVTNQGVQLLGGHGYVQDHPVEKWMREARALSILFGGRDAAIPGGNGP